MTDRLEFRKEAKYAAYSENIKRFHSLGLTLDLKSEYWTLAHDNSDELYFVGKEYGVQPSQFHGVNSEPAIIEACKKHAPSANFYAGEPSLSDGWRQR